MPCVRIIHPLRGLRACSDLLWAPATAAKVGQSAGRTLGTHLSQGAEQGGREALLTSGAGSPGRRLRPDLFQVGISAGLDRQTTFYCASLDCVSQGAHFYSLKVSGNPVSSKSPSAIFPTTVAHFVSLCPILVILTVFKRNSSLLYLLWCSVFSDF